MTLRSVVPVLALAALTSVAGGCSRTYDGSVVPTYEVASDEIAGIPYLTLRRTPLDPPNMRGLSAPPPPDEAVAVSEPDDPALMQPAPERRRALRPAARRAPSAQPARAGPLRCRDEAPGPRLVRMVCE